MPRLGELLVAANVISSAQLEQALRAQVVWGGRLGTNLIELGFIDLDELSRQLGKQHNLPAALARHFDRADPDLQQLLPAELADKHSLVPLLRLAEGQVALAGMDPLDPKGYSEIAGALCVPPAALVMSVAAEQRMRYQLERVYNIARGARYLRSRGGTVPPFPQFGDFSDEEDSEVEIPIDVESEGDGDLDIPIEQDLGDDDPTIAIPRVDTDALAAAIEQAASAAKEGAEPHGRERRAYVKTIDEGAVQRGQHERKREPSRPRKQLGRIAIRKVARTNSPTGLAAASEEKSGGEDSLPDLAKAIRRSPDRDRVAELVIEGLTKYVPACEAAMLFVIRGGTATGWKYFSRSGLDQPELAVPMDQPGLVPQATDLGKTVRKKAAELGELDARLLVELAASARVEGTGDELAVVPIAIHGRVMCVLALACDAGEITPVETIATAAGTAFARLMRDAGR